MRRTLPFRIGFVVLFLAAVGAQRAAVQRTGEVEAAAGAKSTGKAAEPDVAAIRAAARRTAERLRTGSAAWTAVRGTTGFALRFEIVNTPNGRRTTQTVDAPDVAELADRGEAMTVIERDGLWYVREPDSPPTKCRPHEYPFRVPSVPVLLLSAEVQTLDPEGRGPIGTFDGLQGTVATYRILIDPPVRRQVEAALRQLATMEKKAPDALPPEAVEQRARLLRLLERGVPMRVDVSTGVIVEHGNPGATVRIENFRFLDVPPPDALSVDGTEWVDRSDGPLAGGRDSDDLVMFIHSRVWRPGMESREADGRILHPATGRLWRIPFPGEGSMPRCFLPGRKAVAVAGVSSSDGGFGLYRIDLETCEVRRLGGDTFATGLPGDAALSPDGRTLAVVHIPSVGDPSVRRVYRLDLESDVAEPIGEPINVNVISWLRDGSGLVAVRMDSPDDVKAPWVGMVCRLGLDGKVTELFRGANAVVLDARRMLFRDQGEAVWKTCALDGSGPVLFGDGLKEYAFPAPSPDGRRIVLMRNDPKRGPTPYVFRSDGSNGRPLTGVEGFWASPQWR